MKTLDQKLLEDILEELKKLNRYIKKNQKVDVSLDGKVIYDNINCGGLQNE